MSVACGGTPRSTPRGARSAPNVTGLCLTAIHAAGRRDARATAPLLSPAAVGALLDEPTPLRDDIDLYMKVLDDMTGDYGPVLSRAERAKRFCTVINAISRVSTTVTSDVYKRVAQRLELPGADDLADGQSEDQRRYLMEFCSWIQNAQRANQAVNANLTAAAERRDAGMAGAAECVEKALWVAARGSDVSETLYAVLIHNQATSWYEFVAALGGRVRVNDVLADVDEKIDLYEIAASSGILGLHVLLATLPLANEDATLGTVSLLGSVARTRNFHEWPEFLAAVGGAAAYVVAFVAEPLETREQLVIPAVREGSLAFVAQVLEPLRESEDSLDDYEAAIKLVASTAVRYGKINVVREMIARARAIDEAESAMSEEDSDDDGNVVPVHSQYPLLKEMARSVLSACTPINEQLPTPIPRPVLGALSVDRVLAVIRLLEPPDVRREAVLYVARHAGDPATLATILTRVGADHAPRLSIENVYQLTGAFHASRRSDLAMSYPDRLRILGALLDFYEPLGFEPPTIEEYFFDGFQQQIGGRTDVTLPSYLLLLATGDGRSELEGQLLNVELLDFVAGRYDPARHLDEAAMAAALPRLFKRSYRHPQTARQWTVHTTFDTRLRVFNQFKPLVHGYLDALETEDIANSDAQRLAASERVASQLADLLGECLIGSLVDEDEDDEDDAGNHLAGTFTYALPYTRLLELMTAVMPPNSPLVRTERVREALGNFLNDLSRWTAADPHRLAAWYGLEWQPPPPPPPPWWA